MGDDKVWAEGLVCFYAVFQYLEEAIDRLEHTLVGELDIEGMRRTKAFQEDIEFYFGKDWLEKSYIPRAEVVEYLEHLARLEKTDPILLTAYIYHLYVGLFSGGQILRKKRSLQAKMTLFSSANTESGKGEAVTDFGQIPIHKLKSQMMERMEYIADQLGEEDKWKLIEESKNVFRMNNKMIKTINTNSVIIRKCMNFSLVVIPVIVGVYFSWKLVNKT